jgi:hypothetical protein
MYTYPSHLSLLSILCYFILITSTADSPTRTPLECLLSHSPTRSHALPRCREWDYGLRSFDSGELVYPVGMSTISSFIVGLSLRGTESYRLWVVKLTGFRSRVLPVLRASAVSYLVSSVPLPLLSPCLVPFPSLYSRLSNMMLPPATIPLYTPTMLQPIPSLRTGFFIFAILKRWRHPIQIVLGLSVINELYRTCYRVGS